MTRAADPAGGGERLTPEAALALLERADLLDLGRRADAACRARHGDRARTFAIDRNINFTNACTCRCLFCAFWRPPDDPEAYVLAPEAVAAKVEEAVALGATHILMQGGLNPALDLAWHERLLAHLRERFPDIALHAYSPPEIADLADRSGLAAEDVLRRLRAAGLSSLPGGGAEVLADRVRQVVSPRKLSADGWLNVMRAAHRLGMMTTATMVVGHAETPAERIDHLDRVRRLQDEALAAGRTGFQSFILWPFQPGQTRLAMSGRLGPGWRPMDGAAYLRMVAVARLVLDNVPHLQASWVTMGPKLGQAALGFGADDLGSTMIEENVVAAAGCVHRTTPRRLAHLIRAAGFEPVQRDCTYRPVRP